jgi:uncharacterized protein (DUF2126 family)/transglutaminase-like putative cysteine protease
MGIRVALNHTTTYEYDRPVTLLPHIIRLRPAPHTRTPIISYSLRVEPAEQFLNWQQDPYSNYLARLVFPKPAKKFQVVVDVVAEMVPINPFDFFLEAAAEKFPFTYDAETRAELTPYLEAQPLTPKVAELVEAMRLPSMTTNDYIVALNSSIRERVDYVIRMEPGVQAPEETLTLGKGSCRDSAWLLVQVARNLGLAARFCSGYLIQLIADEKPLDDGPAGPTVDFTDLHAWVEVYLPGAGWVGLDPTSGLLAAEGHIPLACTATPQTAAAISGGFAWDKAEHHEGDELGEKFEFHMSVTRVLETPRVAKPYTPIQWQAIHKLGQFIDRDLVESDVRLTMGGEPTFVSIDRRDAPEWNIAALGKHKRQSGMELVKRLRDKFALGGFIHFGQGKWYPGESLPRWAFNCYWRKDGEPIWEDMALLADESHPQGYGPEDAKKFLDKLTEVLGITNQHAMAGLEDTWYYLWKERRLPTNVDPLKNKLDNPEDRARLAKVFEQGLDKIIGYAIPLRRSYATGANWETGPWFLRKEHLFLIPGDSPMGFRLPLDSIAWEPKHERQFVDERDPFTVLGPLAPRTMMQPSLPEIRYQPEFADRGPTSRKPLGDLPPHLRYDGDESRTATVRRFAPVGDEASHNIVRTALCVEPRNGNLYVFMPPMRFVEDYLELVAALEATAKILHMPILIEGYRPPFDPRIQLLGVTPDPGVIEVNTHPVATWEELVHNTTTLYEEARLTRLCTEKFLHDGRHTGTGGGNHVVLGGPTPADSPILRRPDLLRSMIAYWNNHPSLSYLFSGMFIGPTSQHPRTDEARHDSLYELEIAFAQVDPARHSPPAWLVDRLFRNLLVDSTGNTHRTELCIDKLYSPDSAAGRLGLLELRGFEMPPHAEMSLVQQLMLRAFVAAFWRKPYDKPLVRWGTELHDRFMLPHFVEQDLHDILDELRQWGYQFDPAWFAPHVEFRFPLIGELASRGVTLELRNAIEPWNVLGEEPAGGGAVRFVDSSVERLQVKVRGMTDPRHVLTCNGRRVPLHPTGTNGEFVAGLRFRAWQPESCLHPTVGVHAPLVLDLLDTWNHRSLGGCTYHVAHPGGRSFETMPVNSREAEGRRLARFYPFGHSPGPVAVPPVETNPLFPFTLDLRTPEQGTYTPPPVMPNATTSVYRNGVVSSKKVATEPAFDV